MNNKTLINKLISVFMAVMIITIPFTLGACKKKKNDTAASAEETTAEVSTEAETESVISHENEARSMISGKWVAKESAQNRPVAVMYSNIYQALPQSSISYADIVFESLVEGGITRLCAIFENQPQLTKIGPVRSCRTYYLLFAKEFEAFYVHFGASDYAKPYLSQAKFSSLDGMVYCNFYRTDDRIAPHNAYTSWDGIMDSVGTKGFETTYPEGYLQPFLFNTDDKNDIEITEGTSCSKFYPGYTYNNPWFEYNAETKEYLRYQFDEPQIDKETEQQLSFKNVIVKYVKPSYYDNGTPNYKTYGSGKGLFITNGKCVDVTWVKESETSGATKYYYGDGTEITLNAGKTFICQVETSQEVTIVE